MSKAAKSAVNDDVVADIKRLWAETYDLAHEDGERIRWIIQMLIKGAIADHKEGGKVPV
jgi:hypothetical protein